MDGFFADGIAAVTKYVPGLPGLVGLAMVVGDVSLSSPDSSNMVSQEAIALSVKP